MIRMLLCCVLLLFTVVESADAQAFGRNRFRRRYPSTPTAQNPVVTIQSPTGQPTHQTPDPSIILTGTVSDGDGVAVSVSVTNTTTAQTVPCQLTTATTWSCGAGGGGGAQIVFSDTFNTGSNTFLELHDPNIGPASTWTEIFDSPGPRSIYAHTSGVARANTSGTGYGVIYRADPDPAVSGNSYDVSFKNAVAFSTNATSSIIFRIVDGANYCFLKVYGSGRSPDLELGTWTSGTTSTSLGTANANPGTTSTILLEVRGTNLTVKVDGTTVITATSTYCDDTQTVGLGMGKVNGIATDQLDTQYIDDFTITDQDTTNTLDLSLGMNTLVVTAIDDDGNMGSRQVVVTRAGDTQAPLISITSPNGGLDYPTSSASLVVAVDTSDNVETTSVQVKVGAGSFSACTLSGSGLVKTAVCPAVTLSIGANTVTVRATDAAANFAEDTLTATYSLLDITAPSISITTNGGSPLATTNPVLVLAGTASDNVAVTQVDYTCTTCSPTTGVVTTQPTNWQFTSIGLGVGPNLITVTAHDQAANGPGTDTITVTYTVQLSILTSSPLATVSEDVAMQTKVITAVGGTPPYTWTIDGSPPTLNTGDPQCAGTAWADVGNDFNATGTPTTVGECSFTVRVTDGAATTTTKTFVFNVAAVGSGPHAYFESLITRADFRNGLSMRPTGVTCTTTHNGVSFASGTTAAATCNPYFSTQMTTYRNGTGTVDYPNVAYDYPGGDPYAQKQDAARLPIEAYGPLSAITLHDPITSTTQTRVKFRRLGGYGGWNSCGAAYLLGTEIMTSNQNADVDPVAAGNQCAINYTDATGSYYEFEMLRGAYGTTKATHAAGTVMNTVTAGIAGAQQFRVPITLTESSTVKTYLITWDYWMGPETLGIAGTGQKTWQFSTNTSSGIMFELKHSYLGNPIYAGTKCVGHDRALHTHAMHARIYNQSYQGHATWAETPADTLGPNTTWVGSEIVGPFTVNQCVFPGRWTRVWMRFTLRENDWDDFNLWQADEAQEAVQIYNDLLFSLKNSGDGTRTIKEWRIEFNDSAYVHLFPTGDPLRFRQHYFRNFAVLEATGEASAGSLSDANMAALLVKPLPD